MKKIITLTLALAVTAGASLSASTPAKNKKKAEVKTTAVTIPPTVSDSTSFAMGYEATDGLINYLTQRSGLDTAYMADFISAFSEAVSHEGDPHSKARIAGYEIAHMVTERMLPSVEQANAKSGLSLNRDLFYKGFTAALNGDKNVFASIKDAADYNRKAMSAKGEQWLAQIAAQPGIKKLPCGVLYKVIKEGNGAKPQRNDEVQVIYEGRLMDGTVFDATEKHQESKDSLGNIKPDKFNVGHLIKGWTEALLAMPVGSKWDIYIPYDLAYGENGAGQDIPPYAPLAFTLELKDIVKPEPVGAFSNNHKEEASAKKAEPVKKTAKPNLKKRSRRK